MKNDPTPPAKCLDMLKMTEGEHFRRIRREYRMAHNVNDGYQADVKKAMEAFADVKEVQQILSLKIAVLESHLEHLSKRSEIGESFISAAESAIEVKESEFSVSVASRVQDAEDVDHM